MLVMHPRFCAPLCFEHKMKGEAVSPEQVFFEKAWIGSGGDYCRGDYQAAWDYLVEAGLIDRGALPVP